MYTLLVILVLSTGSTSTSTATELVHGFSTLELCEKQIKIIKKDITPRLNKHSSFICVKVQ